MPKWKKAYWPRQAQQDSETDNCSQVLLRGAAVCYLFVGPHALDLDQNHDEHWYVAQQNPTNKCQHCHVEGNTHLQPAAVGVKREERRGHHMVYDNCEQIISLSKLKNHLLIRKLNMKTV